MQKFLPLITILIWFLIVGTAKGALITGTVYDYNLNETEAVVKISTVPEQVKVTHDGTYSFGLSRGNYTVSASTYAEGLLAAYAEQDILIEEEGNYTVDLILFPEIPPLNEGLHGMTLPNITFPESGAGFAWQMSWQVWIAAGFAAIIIIAIFTYYWRRDKVLANERKDHGAFPNRHRVAKPAAILPPEKGLAPENEPAEDILSFIRKEGHTTQKEIRKKFPFSEAKVSLVLTDLEARGLIRKVKKGRGNVIVFNK